MGIDIWSTFAPSIVKYIETLLRDGKVGICAGNIGIIDVCSGCPSSTRPPCADRFKLVLPYGGHSLTWEVLFNCDYPEYPPDFIFSDEDKDFYPNLDEIQGLVEWNANNPQALLLVIQGLVSQYRRFQENIISQSSRLSFEFTSLIDHGNLSVHDVEIHGVRKGEYSRLGPVNFLIKLPVDFSRLPPYLTQNNPGDDLAVLLVNFQTPDGNKVTPQLYLSPRLDHALGGAAHLRIPNFPHGGCLIDYVPNVKELLKNKVDQVVQGYEKRKDYIAAFLSLNGRCVLEYDTEGFSKITFLFEWNDFFFIVMIELPLIFPIDQPVFTFQSIYHETMHDKPFIKVVKEYPYSPRWSGREMAERARVYFDGYAPIFQKASLQNTKKD